MPETFDEQLQRLREIAANSHRFGGCAPDDFLSESDCAALAELLRRWDAQRALLDECAQHIEGVTGALAGSDSADLVARIRLTAPSIS